MFKMGKFNLVGAYYTNEDMVCEEFYLGESIRFYEAGTHREIEDEDIISALLERSKSGQVKEFDDCYGYYVTPHSLVFTEEENFLENGDATCYIFLGEMYAELDLVYECLGDGKKLFLEENLLEGVELDMTRK